MVYIYIYIYAAIDVYLFMTLLLLFISTLNNSFYEIKKTLKLLFTKTFSTSGHFYLFCALHNLICFKTASQKIIGLSQPQRPGR